MESSEFHILIYFEVKEEKKNKKILLNFQSICDWSSILINLCKYRHGILVIWFLDEI